MKLHLTLPFVQQHEAMDCGPACLSMVAKYHGFNFPLSYLRSISHLDREGVSLAGIAQAAEDIGFRSMPIKLPLLPSELKPVLIQAPLPFIAHWNQKHFVVIYHLDRNRVGIADPAAGKITLSTAQFLKHWEQDGGEGIAMLFEPTPEAYKFVENFNNQGYTETDEKKPTLWLFLAGYFVPHKKLFWQLINGLVVGAMISLAIPFVTQSIVDIAIKGKDQHFLLIILIGHFALVAGQTFV
jgi:ATP-binding cassette, subfamily B, bacterial